MIGRLILIVIALILVGALVYTGLWQVAVLFVWQHPMLSWLPILTVIVVGQLLRLGRALSGGNLPQAAGSDAQGAAEPALGPMGEPIGVGELAIAEAGPAAGERSAAPRGTGRRVAIALGSGLLVFLVGLYFTVISPPAVGLDDIDYELVQALPERTQPRLLPRVAVRDDPAFADAEEIHLARDPAGGELMWTGEWQPSWLTGPSSGVAVKSLDDLVSESEIFRGGFDESVSAFGPGTLKWEAKLRHPFSRTQYPVLIPTGEREAIAVAPYVGYRGFPFRTPYLKGVLVYHQDGTIEDLSPDEAAERPELAQTGRIIPETVAREQAEAIAASDEVDGEIVDGEGNRQPFLTAIDSERTVWMTVINEPGQAGRVSAVVLADSSTGETDVWRAPEDAGLVSTREVIDEARALPLRWSERRCCDSDGHSYTVTLREVVEPRLAFKDGRPYYMVTVVPTSELAIGREVEYTLLIDALSGEQISRFAHVEGGPVEDARLERFFRPDR